MIRYLNAFKGLILLLFFLRKFNTLKFFKDKSIAIVGPGSSSFEDEKGAYIDNCDIVMRFNKTPCVLNEENKKFIGSKTDILFHCLYEEAYLDINLFKKKNIKYVLYPRNTNKGIRHIFNFYKKYLLPFSIYLLNKKTYNRITTDFGKFNPTMGYCGLYSVLESDFKSCYITGFSFYQTGYAKGYDDNFKPSEKYYTFLKNYISPHDPKLERELFFRLLNKNRHKTIILDNYLKRITHKIKG